MRPDLSVLSPAMEGRYFVAEGFDPTMLLPPNVALSGFSRGQRSDQLRALVARERYRPERTIADRLIDALAGASYDAVLEPIPRKPAGSLQSLSWSDLPENPAGALMLDVTIRWICLCADMAFSKHYPAISIAWRLLDAGQSVVQPTTVITYFHYPAWYQRKRSPAAADDGAPAEIGYPAVEVSENCGFRSVKDAARTPEVLWGCLGEAYDAALQRLVIDLARLHPPPVRDRSVQPGA